MKTRALALTLFVASIPAGARAQSPRATPRAASAAAEKEAARREEVRKEAEAAALKKRGDEALAGKRYEEALAAYEQSYAIVPNPALHYNRGRALEFLARYPEALAEILRFDEQASAELKARVPGLPDLIRDLRARVATIRVQCNVAGAKVLVADKLVATTPLDKPVEVNAGTAKVEVFADGYFPFKRQLALKGGATTEIDAPLASRDTMGYLVVQSPLPGARVTFDGRAAGVVPAEAALSVGSHLVALESEGYEPGETTVVLRAGERREVSVPLKKARPLTSRWWFWTAVGVVVVGTAVVVGVIAAQTEKDPPTGDNFSPAQTRF